MVGVVIKIYAVLKTNINYIWYPLFTASVLWKAIYTCTEFTAVNRNIVINWKLNIINKTCFYIIFVKNIGRIRTPYVYTWSYNSVLFSIYNFKISACFIFMSLNCWYIAFSEISVVSSSVYADRSVIVIPNRSAQVSVSGAVIWPEVE